MFKYGGERTDGPQRNVGVFFEVSYDSPNTKTTVTSRGVLKVTRKCRTWKWINHNSLPFQRSRKEEGQRDIRGEYLPQTDNQLLPSRSSGCVFSSLLHQRHHKLLPNKKNKNKTFFNFQPESHHFTRASSRALHSPLHSFRLAPTLTFRRVRLNWFKLLIGRFPCSR